MEGCRGNGLRFGSRIVSFISLLIHFTYTPVLLFGPCTVEVHSSEPDLIGIYCW